MINQILAKRYAKALLTLGREDGNFEQYGEELGGFVTFWESETEFADAASNPLYAKEDRKTIVNAVVDKMDLSPVFKSLLDLMIEKNRLTIVPEVGIFYQKLLDELNNISRAKVTSATPLSEEAMESIKASLEKTTGSSIIVEAEVDPELIGGVVARVGDLVLDGSVRNQLTSIKETLIKG
ncbi:MAG: ATP synthase F1 subunit delta [Deltaproteobacteria bacterium]|nr:MAG: ATP synthase F1 subunit delta [Deltaproteobacteria bacterium]